MNVAEEIRKLAPSGPFRLSWAVWRLGLLGIVTTEAEAFESFMSDGGYIVQSWAEGCPEHRRSSIHAIPHPAPTFADVRTDTRGGWGGACLELRETYETRRQSQIAAGWVWDGVQWDTTPAAKVDAGIGGS